MIVNMYIFIIKPIITQISNTIVIIIILMKIAFFTHTNDKKQYCINAILDSINNVLFIVLTDLQVQKVYKRTFA